MNTKIRTGFYFLGGFLFLADRCFKYLALQTDEKILLFQKIGWHPWLNPDGAFSYPASNSIIILLSIPLFAALIFLFIRFFKKSADEGLFFFLIILGALSNIFDRLVYAGVIDYFYFFWGSINIADILILVGTFGCLINLKKS